MTDNQAATVPENQQELPAALILTMLWRGRWIIVICGVISMLLGLGYVTRRGTLWTASSTLLVEGSAPTILTGNVLVQGKNPTEAIALQLRSTEIVRDAVISLPGQGAQLPGRALGQKVSWLRGSLRVSVGEKNDSISVGLDSEDKVSGCDAVNAVVEHFMDHRSKRKKESLSDLLKHFTKKHEEQIQKVAALEKEELDFIEANKDVGFSRTRVADQEYTALQQKIEALRLAGLQLAEVEANWRLAKRIAANPIMLSSAPNGSAMSSFIQRVRQLEDGLRMLQIQRETRVAEVKPTHASVVALDKHIATQHKLLEELKTAVQEEADWNLARVTAQKDADARWVESLTKQVEAQRNLYEDLGPKVTRSRNLTNQIEDARDLLAIYKGKLSQIDIATFDKQDQAFLDVTVFEEARPEFATKATSDSRAIMLFLAMGLLLGCGLAWMRGMMDHRVRSMEDVTEGIPLEVLSTMPRTANVGEDSAIAGWDEIPEFAEAARSLRTAVYFGTPKEQGKVIHISSPEPNDGKSLICSNLAIAMAQAGQRTLVIDADLRNPTQAKSFHLLQTSGLSTALSSDEPVESVIQKTSLENLDVMTSGPKPPNPAEILNSQEFEDLLLELSRTYDRILVDSPPVLPVADARIIATKCGVTILVLRVDKTTRKQARAAVASISSVGSKVLGAVLNDMPRRGIGYGYGGYYGGRYGYGDDEDTKRDKHRRSHVNGESNGHSAGPELENGDAHPAREPAAAAARSGQPRSQ